MKRYLLFLLLLLCFTALMLGCAGTDETKTTTTESTTTVPLCWGVPQEPFTEDGAIMQSFRDGFDKNGYQDLLPYKGFENLFRNYTYLGTPFSELTVEFAHADGVSGGMYQQSIDDAFLARETYNLEDDGSYLDTFVLTFNYDVGGVVLPSGVTFDINLASALSLYGISLDYREAFVDEVGVILLKTLSDGTVTGDLTLIDCSLAEDAPGFPIAYRLQYREAYDTRNASDIVVRYTKCVLLDFGDEGDTLSSVTYQIEQRTVYDTFSVDDAFASSGLVLGMGQSELLALYGDFTYQGKPVKEHPNYPNTLTHTAPNGETGLNYLCKGYHRYFNHVAPYMDYMRKMLQSGEAPARVMEWAKKY